jgi:hypothetical protein
LDQQGDRNVKALIRLVLVLVVLAVLAVGGLAFAGIVQVPVVSSLVGMDKPRDLGSTGVDPVVYKEFIDAHGFKLPSPAGNYTLNSLHTFSGSVPMDEVIGEAEINTLGEIRNPSPAFKNVTIRFHDGYAETAAMVDLSGFGYPASGPVYAKWSITVNGPKSVTVDLQAVELGRIPVPADIAAKASDALNTYLAGRLATIDGLSIETFAMEEAGVHFVGTLPETYEAGVPAAGQLP